MQRALRVDADIDIDDGDDDCTANCGDGSGGDDDASKIGEEIDDACSVGTVGGTRPGAFTALLGLGAAAALLHRKRRRG